MSNQELAREGIPTIEELLNKQKVFESKLVGKVENPKEELEALIARSYSFLFQRLDYLELKDQKLVNRTFKRICQYGVGALLSSCFLNISLAKITRNYIFELPRFVRFSVRTVLFVVPLSLYSQYAYQSYYRVSLYLLDKYMERIELFMVLGDPKIINPFLEQENKGKNLNQ